MQKIEKLEHLRQHIESLEKFHQTEILKILHEKVDKEVLNENNNGTFVNLSSLSDDIIYDLEIYLNYVSKQETQLDALETQKEEFKVKYFQKENKDNTTQLTNEC
jgi:predicted component of viral defense system (DUF524 family)